MAKREACEAPRDLAGAQHSQSPVDTDRGTVIEPLCRRGSLLVNIAHSGKYQEGIVAVVAGDFAIRDRNYG